MRPQGVSQSTRSSCSNQLFSYICIYIYLNVSQHDYTYLDLSYFHVSNSILFFCKVLWYSLLYRHSLDLFYWLVLGQNKTQESVNTAHITWMQYACLFQKTGILHPSNIWKDPTRQLIKWDSCPYAENLKHVYSEAFSPLGHDEACMHNTDMFLRTGSSLILVISLYEPVHHLCDIYISELDHCCFR